MQDQSIIKKELETVSIIAAVMGIVSLTLEIFIWSPDFTPAAHFVVGLIMVATVIIYAVSATLKTVYKDYNEGISAGWSWFVMGCWFGSMAFQFAYAATTSPIPRI